MFAVDAAEHKWLMQKVDKYADQTMKLVTFKLDATPTYADAAKTLHDKTTKANELMAGSCTNLTSGGAIPLSTAGSCVKLKVDNSNEGPSWTIDTTGVKGLAILRSMSSTEFNADTHFLRAGDAGVEAEKSLEVATTTATLTATKKKKLRNRAPVLPGGSVSTLDNNPTADHQRH